MRPIKHKKKEDEELEYNRVHIVLKSKDVNSNPHVIILLETDLAQISEGSSFPAEYPSKTLPTKHSALSVAAVHLTRKSHLILCDHDLANKFRILKMPLEIDDAKINAYELIQTSKYGARSVFYKNLKYYIGGSIDHADGNGKFCPVLAVWSYIGVFQSGASVSSCSGAAPYFSIDMMASTKGNKIYGLSVARDSNFKPVQADYFLLFQWNHDWSVYSGCSSPERKVLATRITVSSNYWVPLGMIDDFASKELSIYFQKYESSELSKLEAGSYSSSFITRINDLGSMDSMSCLSDVQLMSKTSIREEQLSARCRSNQQSSVNCKITQIEQSEFPKPQALIGLATNYNLNTKLNNGNVVGMITNSNSDSSFTTSSQQTHSSRVTQASISFENSALTATDTELSAPVGLNSEIESDCDEFLNFYNTYDVTDSSSCKESSKPGMCEIEILKGKSIDALLPDFTLKDSSTVQNRPECLVSSTFTFSSQQSSYSQVASSLIQSQPSRASIQYQPMKFKNFLKFRIDASSASKGDTLELYLSTQIPQKSGFEVISSKKVKISVIDCGSEKLALSKPLEFTFDQNQGIDGKANIEPIKLFDFVQIESTPHPDCKLNRQYLRVYRDPQCETYRITKTSTWSILHPNFNSLDPFNNQQFLYVKTNNPNDISYGIQYETTKAKFCFEIKLKIKLVCQPIQWYEQSTRREVTNIIKISERVDDGYKWYEPFQNYYLNNVDTDCPLTDVTIKEGTPENPKPQSSLTKFAIRIDYNRFARSYEISIDTRELQAGKYNFMLEAVQGNNKAYLQIELEMMMVYQPITPVITPAPEEEESEDEGELIVTGEPDQPIIQPGIPDEGESEEEETEESEANEQDGNAEDESQEEEDEDLFEFSDEEDEALQIPTSPESTASQVVKDEVVVPKQKDGSIAIGAWKPSWQEKASADEVESLFKSMNQNKFSQLANQEPLKLIVKSISRSGYIKMQFNQEIVVPEFDTYLSLEDIDVSRDIMNLKFNLMSDVNPRYLRFTLDITEWTATHLTVFVNFTNPLLISKGEVRDKVFIKIKNPQIFISKETGFEISQVIQYYPGFPRQLPKGQSEEDLQSNANAAKDSFIAIIIIQILLQIFLKGAINDIWAMFLTLQLCAYSSIYEVQIPANVEIYVEEFRKMLMFEFLDPEALIQNTFDEDFTFAGFLNTQQASVSSSLESSGQSTCIVCNMMVYIFIIFMFVLALLILLIVKKINKIKAKVEELLKSTIKKTFWNGFIRSITISYLETSVQLLIALNNIKNGVGSMAINWLTSIALSVFLTAYPTIILTVLVLKREELNHKEFKDRFENAYQDISLNRSKWGILYYPVFISRRLIFVLIPLIFESRSFYQLQTAIFLHSIYLIIYTSIWPHIIKGQAYIEIFNESMFMLMWYTMVLFTDFNPSYQFQAGFIYLSVLALIAVVNISYVIHRQIKLFKRRRAVKKLRRILQRKNSITIFDFMKKTELKLERVKPSKMQLLVKEAVAQKNQEIERPRMKRTITKKFGKFNVKKAMTQVAMPIILEESHQKLNEPESEGISHSSLENQIDLKIPKKDDERSINLMLDDLINDLKAAIPPQKNPTITAPKIHPRKFRKLKTVIY